MRASWMAAVAALCGCAARPNQTVTQPETSFTSTASASLPNTENGLEVRQWTVLDQPQRLRSAVVVHRDGAAVDADTEMRLQRNGLRLVRIPRDRVDALLEDIGGATVDNTQWHGQVHRWRSLIEKPLDASGKGDSPYVSASGRAIAVDGKLRRYVGGGFRLMMRSWTVQMEDGPRIQLEVLPQHHRAQTGNLRRLLGERDEAIDGFAGLALDIRLEAGYAYVLLADSPQADWSVDGSTASAAPTPSSAPPRTSQRQRVGPFESVGPDAPAPMTLGELLLSSQGKPPTREVLVFVPKIAAQLFPPGSEPAPPVAFR